MESYSTNRATIDTKAAVDSMKKITAAVEELEERSKRYSAQVHEAYDKTNMPIVNQIFDIATKLQATLKNIQQATSEAYDITTRYADEAEHLANDGTAELKGMLNM